MARLVDLLPTSIQHLRLLVDENIKSFEELFEGLTSEKHLVPKLAVIQLSRFWKDVEKETQWIRQNRNANNNAGEREIQAWELPLPESIARTLGAAGIHFEYKQEIPKPVHIELCKGMR
jgi:hypothetical protein